MRSAATAESIAIPVGKGQIEADLRIPERATGLVMFAHGSGSSRFSTRNRFVAGFLDANGFGTLLLDLLTREEEAIDIHTREYRFDIDRLARRIVLATDWAQNRNDLQSLPVGYFGASTGAAAALVAAAGRPDVVRAIVSRGGRPDLADGWLQNVMAPTLLIVGGDDELVIGMNRDAMRQMGTTVELSIVPGATHLFEEAGTLEQVMQLSAAWFRRYLSYQEDR
jgi:putative phosphoribosyl transferase